MLATVVWVCIWKIKSNLIMWKATAKKMKWNEKERKNRGSRGKSDAHIGLNIMEFSERNLHEKQWNMKFMNVHFWWQCQLMLPHAYHIAIRDESYSVKKCKFYISLRFGCTDKQKREARRFFLYVIFIQICCCICKQMHFFRKIIISDPCKRFCIQIYSFFKQRHERKRNI